MMTKLSEFDSIGPAYAKKLEDSLCIAEIDDFYQYSLNDIMAAANVPEKTAQQWIDILDLFRIPLLDARNSEFLVAANINSVEELSHRSAKMIFYKLKEIDVETYIIVLDMPSFKEIDTWIYYAKLMTMDIRVGLNIPIVMLPMINIKIGETLEFYRIYTLEDLVDKLDVIKNMRKVLKMNRDEYKAFERYVDLLSIDGIGLKQATPLANTDISIESLKSMTQNEIKQKALAAGGEN